MDAYRTSSLFHYTSHNNLKRILEGGLMPNYCKEDFSNSRRLYVVGIPMVSFCDIPITRTQEFTRRYGRHAIGLSKEWAMKNNANPILYSHIDDTFSGLQFLKAYEMANREAVRQAGGNDNEIPINVGPNGEILGLREFFNAHSSFNAVLNLFGYIKKFRTTFKGDTIDCYEENEWRYVVAPTEQIKWLWSSDEYDAWRGNSQNKPEPSAELKNKTLKFKVDDITSIILEQENQINGMIKKVQSMKYIGGNPEVLTDTDKMKLISKLISLERIARDF